MIRPSPIERAFGLQAGEAYGADEECYTRKTKRTYMNRDYEVFYRENACMWEAWCNGIGSVSDFRGPEFVIAEMKRRIENEVKNTTPTN